MRAFLAKIRRESGKWLESIKISLSKSLNYKINFLLMMVIPAIVFFAIKWNLWQSIYAVHPEEKIQGYSLAKMIEYQFWILIFELFSRSHFFSQDLSSDIRLGKISSFLLYPFSFINYQASLFFSDKLLQFFIGAFSLFLALAFGWLSAPPAGALLKAGAFVLAVSAFWLFAQMIIGFLAFWLEETWGINISLRFISAFFSGAIIPLDLFPEALAKILLWTPFPHLTYIPIKILMGEPERAFSSFLTLLLWLLALIFSARWIWKRGLKLYSGAGI